MASSGSFHTTAYSGRYLTFAWEETSQNATGNTTTISWTLKGAGGDSTWYYTRNIKVTIAGETVYHFPQSEGKVQLKKGTLVASGSYTFTHDDDGTKSFEAYAEAGIYKYAVNCTGSATFSLDTIARGSQPTLSQSEGEFGDTITIYMNRKVETYTHTVRYTFGSLSDTIETDVAIDTEWTVPLSLMNQIPYSPSGSVRIYVDTYNGGSLIGTSSCLFTAAVPESAKPSCTCALIDTSGARDIIGAYVKGMSVIQATVTPTEAYGSPIMSYSIVMNGVRYSSSVATSGVLTESGTVSVTVTDGRGRSGTWSQDITVLDYTAPRITKLTVHRCNSDGTENDGGEYVKVAMSAEIAPLGNKNSAAYYCWYKEHSATDYETGISETYIMSPDYSPDGLSFIFEADGSCTFDIEASVTDSFNADTRTTTVSTAFTLMNWNAKGNGLGIGKVSEKEHTLEIDMDVEIHGKSLFDLIYPVGSIYLAYNHVDPSTLFGGIWVRLENAFLLATTSTGTIGQKGGSSTHSHELGTNGYAMINHHDGAFWFNELSGVGYYHSASGKATASSANVTETQTAAIGLGGSTESENSMPPYIQISAWRRTA